MTLPGNLAMKASMSLRGVIVPVGLFGFTMYTSPVPDEFVEVPEEAAEVGSILPSIAGKSCSYRLFSGTSATSMPPVCASLPSAGNVGAASTSFLPGLRNVIAAMHKISPEPQPSTICSRFTLCSAATLSTSVSYSVRG